MTKHTITVEEDPDTGELLLPFTPEILAELGWSCGDTIVWKQQDDGSFILTKKETND
jgi:hypothetical protein